MTFYVYDGIDNLSQCNPSFFSLTTCSKAFFETLKLGFHVYQNSRFKKTGLNIERMTLRECFDAIRGFRRRENDVAFLQKDETWQLFSENAQHNVVLQQQLAETHEKFEHQEKFSTHTNVSLLEAYENLEQIKQLLYSALKEVSRAKKRWLLSRRTRSELYKYHHYLIQQWAILKQEHEDCVMHMLWRLIQAAKDPLLQNTDTLPDIINNLKSKGFLKATYTAPTLADNSLTPEQFYQFHKILKKDSNSEILTALYALPWFKSRTLIAARFRVAHLVPESKKRPEFLFYNHNLRYHWFDHFHPQAKIDATLEYLRMGRVQGELNAASLSQRMVSVYSAEQALLSEKNRVNNARKASQKGWRRFFSEETLLFLDGIQAAHKKLEIRLLNEKIELLRFICVTPIEEIQSLNIVKFLDSINAHISEKTNAKFKHYRKILRQKLEIFMEDHLQKYFYQWSSCSRIAALSQTQLEAFHAEAEEQEQLLFRVLPYAWSERVRAMRILRTSKKFNTLELSAQLGLQFLITEKPTVLQKVVKREFQMIRENITEYLKNMTKDFNYLDQKNILLKMVDNLAEEKSCEAEKSSLLSVHEREFLKSFPEVNFFINVMLKLNQEEKILDEIYNPKEIEEHIEGIHRFIRRQEAVFLNKHKVLFSSLFCKPDQPSENRVFIHQLKRAIL